MKTKECSECNGKGKGYFSCCTHQMVEEELAMCPICKEHLGEDICEGCDGTGVVEDDLDLRVKTMFFKTLDGIRVGTCFRVLNYKEIYMIHSNDWKIQDIIDAYTKEHHKVSLPNCFEDEREAFDMAKDIAKKFNFTPFIK